MLKAQASTDAPAEVDIAMRKHLPAYNVRGVS
jgi:hypothetical protein